MNRYELDGEPWQAYAMCARVDPEAWFSEYPGARAAARRICLDSCPVRENCLEDALTNRDPHQPVRAGLTVRQRDAIAKKRGLRYRRVTAPATYDIVAVEQAVAGLRPADQITAQERVQAVRMLHARGWSDGKIGNQLRLDVRTVMRIRHRNGLPALPQSRTNYPN